MNRVTLITAVLLCAMGCKEPDPDPPDPCAGEPTLTVSGDSLSFDLEGCASLELSAVVAGDGVLAVELALVDGAVQPTISGTGTFEGLMLTGTYTVAGDDPVRLWKQGYQSWSWSGVIELEELAFNGDVPVAGGDGNGTSVTDETPATSWWVGVLGRAGGASLLTGALTANKTRFYTAVSGDEIWLIWGHRGERITLDGPLDLDPLVVTAGSDAWQIQVDYAKEVGRALDAPGLPSPPPTGWATWYNFYEEVNEEDVRSNLEFAAGLLEDDTLAPIEVFQIDDGWQVVWGDWVAGDDFPSGMDVLAADIQDAGFTPGLWMAPFDVDRSTATYQQNPDWWVRDANGDPIIYSNLGTGDYAIIDATHPDAGPWMAQQVADRYAEGWTYLKLDFLYAGAEEGQRYADVTGIEAYHVGMQLLREAAGTGWMLACGAPFLPSVGYAQSYRSGADIAFSVMPDPVQAHLRWQVRSTAARSWTNGVWWWIDPDQLMVRPPYNDAQARGAVVAQAISGGPWLLGDDLPALAPQKLQWALSPAAVSTRGSIVRPIDPLSFPSGIDPGPIGEGISPDDQVPERWTFSDGREVLLNMRDYPVDVACPDRVDLLNGEEQLAGTCTLAAGEGLIYDVLNHEETQ